MVTIELSGKVAIVTGGASGLGKAICLKLAEAGAAVVVADINLSSACSVADQIKAMGVPSKAIAVDTTKESEVFDLVDTTVKEFGNLHIMVNNAGIGMMKPILDFTPQEIDKLIDLDLKGVIYGCRAAIKHMKQKQEGKIINTSSVAAKLGVPNGSIYAAAKSGVIALTNSLAREMAECNININAICPGIIRTNMWEKQLNAMAADKTEAQNQIFKGFVDMSIPMKRPQEPEDIANMVLFLCSDLAKNITAQTINVDGGSAIC